MGTNYPGGLDSLTNPSGGDGLSSPSHAAQHANANDSIEAIEAELGTNPRGTASSVRARLDGIENGSRISLPDGSVTPVKLARPIGNLLTDNQARPTTTGAYWYANATETAPGVFTATGAGPLLFTADFPVTAYYLYTGWADFTTVGRSRVVVLQFVDAGSNILSASQSVAVPGGTRGFATVTAEAPAGAVRAALYPAYSAATPPAGEAVTLVTAGTWVGAGGLWQMPGVPIPNLGTRVNPTNTAQVQVWNDATDTWITV